MYIKEIFKLGEVRQEADLHDYKNLLNSMAALFYTNHRVNDVTVMFYLWREAALARQKERVLNQQQQIEHLNRLNQSSSKNPAVAGAVAR